MLGVGDYLWRLIPANPILLRVVESGGKKKRDLAIRCAYLGLLVFFVIFTLFTTRQMDTSSLTDLSNASRQIFRSMSYLQLALVALLAPIFTAGAITQEKDSQTYDILLSTPLTNGQIVLGSLLSRLFFVIALLISGIPIFSVTRIYGGVAFGSIAMSITIAAATAFVTGSLAMAIATFKVGTRRTIFSFYLFIVIYLVGLWLLDMWPYFQVEGPKIAGGSESAHISWFTGIHPFLALRVVLMDPSYRPPEIGMLPPGLRVWPLGWYLTNPASFYISFTFFLSLVLVVPSIVFLRRLAQSTTTLRNWVLMKLRLSKGDRTRKPRGVWHNPIAWREAKTKASAARATVLRWGFIVTGLLGALVMVIMFATPAALPAKYITPGSYNPTQRTLFIHGENQTRGLSSSVKVIMPELPEDRQQVGVDALYRKYEVISYDEGNVTSRMTKPISLIRLRELPRVLDAKQVRQILLGMVVLEVAVILLIVTNAAASTVTREKEDGSLDLLLTTPITSRYYIWGKLRGLVSFVLPLVAVPVISVILFVIYDIIRSLGGSDPNFRWIVFPEAMVVMPPTLIILAAFASIVGMQLSLRCRTTVRAVMASVGAVGGISALLVGCGAVLLRSPGTDNGLHFIFSGFSPFTLIALLIDPYTMADQVFITADPDAARGARIFMFISAFVATAGYAAIVWAMYKSMVKNFDMTIRKQSR
jgi:ABC-type transport system involved in multi-copper enzyme maturation permease subunit